MPEDVEEEASGGRPKTEEDDVFLAALESEGVASTTDVMDYVAEETDWDVSRMQAIRRLKELTKEGEVVRKEGGRGDDWMLKTTFEAIVSDDKFTGAIRAKEGAATTAQVIEKTGFNEGAVLERLHDLEDKDVVKSERVNGNAPTLWVLKPE